MDIPFHLSSIDWLLIAAVFIGLYAIILLPVQNSEKWQQRGISVWGPIPLAIFFRTTRGLNLLDKLSRPKRFWRIVASAGVPLVVLSMAYFLVLVLLMAYLMIRAPPEPSNYNDPRNILLIPGLNEYIPFVWGWIALFVTMVVHEFAHGILSRVEGVRVKSMGIVTFLIAPVAAFVEPDEEELFGSKDKPPIVSKGARVRILAAGVISNFLVAGIAMALFFGPVIGSISPVDRVIAVDVQNDSAGAHAGFEMGMVLLDANGKAVKNLEDLYNTLSGDTGQYNVLYDDRKESLMLEGKPERGIMVASIFEDSPAAAAGLPAHAVITRIDGQEVGDLQGFRQHMNSTRPGQTITITMADGKTYSVLLTSNEGEAGFMGIGISGNAIYQGGVAFQEAPARQALQFLQTLPSRGLQGFTYMLSLPFSGIPGFTQEGFPGFSGWMTAVFQPTGWAEPLGGKIFWLANLLLWVGWINLYAGLFNCLPAVPLDGGHIFRDLVQAGFERVVNAREAERLTRTVVALLAWLVLTSLVITVIAPFTHGLSL